MSSFKGKEISSSELISARKLNLIYHFIAISALIWFAVQFPSRQIIVLGFLSMTIQAVIGTFRYIRKINFKRIGFTLLAYSIIFSVFISLAY